jgi:hypothetical protein
MCSTNGKLPPVLTQCHACESGKTAHQTKNSGIGVHFIGLEKYISHAITNDFYLKFSRIDRI